MAVYSSLILFGLAAAAHADTITGTIKDPTGALVEGARVEITGGTLTQPVVVSSDNAGRFSAPNLAPGKYSVRVVKEGFNESVTPVDLHGTADLALNLTLAQVETSVNVTSKSAGMANSDPVYRALRGDGLGQSFRCENFTFNLDVGTFVLKSGTLTMLDPVNGFETGAIFVGEGHFTLKPVFDLDSHELERRSGSSTLEEDFSSAMFRFSPGELPVFADTLKTKTDTPAEAGKVFEEWKNKLRHRHEVPEGMTQELLESETIDNVDADILAAVYNAKHHPPFFNAYLHGTHHKDLRFFIRAKVGAIPQLDSPEEVALINCDGGDMDDGIWYSEHLASEIAARTANSREDRRLFQTHKYNIETVIAKNAHLYSRATITFQPEISDERVMKFGLLPRLRVTRVTDEDGHELHYIQEDWKQDGSFYAILDQAAEVGKEHSINVEYVGDKVLYDAGGGSFYVGARESWYPNLNGFGEKVLYDLTFKVPPQNVVISVGKLQDSSTEAGFAVSHWVTPTPVAVAGFNYGQYKKMDFPDDRTHYSISGYYLEDLPDSLKAYSGQMQPMGGTNDGAMQGHALGGMNPNAMTKYVLDQTRAQLQLCTYYFGKAPYDNINITEQPNFNFGQSWPNLVYLPISAYIDSTQRWMLFGHIDNNFTGFVREVTPHEVAHQWFGHAVSWASYHDQWLSEGFAEFAAGLFMQQAMGPKWQKDYIDFWERQRERVVEKNNFGISPNDAGPLWMGLRLISPKTESAYQVDTYAKGAYVLLMLRSLMFNEHPPGTADPDQAFIDMMHDFMETHRDVPATTESFKAVAEKHMTKEMDLLHNGKLDWFFSEWVYGTKVPKYEFKYTTGPGDKSSVRVQAEITQSEVDDHFVMFVPVFADFGKGMIRLGQVEMVGNSTRTIVFNMDQQPKKMALNYYKDILER